MITHLWGKKIGMAQLFKNDQVIPVTAIDMDGWYIVGKKVEERDGYTALVIGLVRDRYKPKAFEEAWLKNTKKYFECLKEVKVAELSDDMEVGSPLLAFTTWTEGTPVDVAGNTKGRGFAGVVKRHGFAGPPASHGAKMGRRPGSIGFMTKQGRVIKGKRMPGHLGNVRRTVRNLDLVQIEADKKVIFVKGSTPGHTGSLVSLKHLNNG